jgi:hypothetical protein
MDTQGTIVLPICSLDQQSIHDTCQIENTNLAYKKSEPLSDHDLKLYLEFKNTTNQTKKKLFRFLYYPNKIKRINPVKTVFVEEILMESNQELMIRMLPEENSEISGLVDLLCIYGMTWDIIHSLYLTNTVLSEVEHGREVMFGLRNIDVSLTNQTMVVEIIKKIQEYFILFGNKDLGFWVEFETESDLRQMLDVFIGADWITDYIISVDKLVAVFKYNADKIMIVIKSRGSLDLCARTDYVTEHDALFGF